MSCRVMQCGKCHVDDNIECLLMQVMVLTQNLHTTIYVSHNTASPSYSTKRSQCIVLTAWGHIPDRYSRTLKLWDAHVQ